MRETHTPGPWTTNSEVEHQAVLGPNGFMVADCAIFGFGPDAPSSECCTANGHLVAAAPDLLAACQLACRVLASESPTFAPVRDTCRAAIAKALKRD